MVPSDSAIWGLARLCLYHWVWAVALRMLRGKRWDALLFGIVLMAVYGFSETLGVRFECNYFLFALGAELLYISPVAKELSRPSEERDAVRKKGSVVPRA